MKRFSIRTRLALWTGGLALVVLIIFGAGTAWNLYDEQMEAFQQEDATGKLRPFNEKKEATKIVEDLMQAYLISMPLAVAVAALGGWLVGTRTIRPIGKIVHTAGRINASSLSSRLPSPETNDEIGELTDVLNQMFDRLEQNFVQANRFTADASHEMRTPLAILRGAIEAALKDEEPGPHRELLEALLDQTLRLSGITSKLLLLSRADAGSLGVEMKPVDLTLLCSAISEDVRILADPRRIEIETAIEEGVTLSGDEALLQQALLNLLDNAVKYNHLDGTVRFILRKGSPDILIDIENTGQRIPPELESRIFDRFFRVDASRDRATGGAGLGLSLVREIVLAHKGSIRLMSEKTGWTAFRISLPASSGESV